MDCSTRAAAPQIEPGRERPSPCRPAPLSKAKITRRSTLVESSGVGSRPEQQQEIHVGKEDEKPMTRQDKKVPGGGIGVCLLRKVGEPACYSEICHSRSGQAGEESVKALCAREAKRRSNHQTRWPSMPSGNTPENGPRLICIHRLRSGGVWQLCVSRH